MLQVADYGGAYSGNFVSSLRSLADPCRALGLRLAIAFSDNVKGRPWLDELRADGIAVHLLDARARLSQRANAVARIAEAERAALIHTHFHRWDVPAALASRNGRRARLVWHAHSPFPPERRLDQRAKEAVKLRVLGRRARVAAVSEAIMQEIVGSGFPAARACYIPNGVDLAHSTTPRDGREAVRRELSVPDGARLALVFGWDPLRKGVDLALDAFASLAANDPPLVLAVVGTDALAKLLDARLGAERPRWLRFLRPREHVADLYAAADVFLSASRAEGYPYALGEALANGLPCVVSDIPGCEWARDVEGTRYFASGDAAGLAGALADMARWPAERRARYAVAARALAFSRLSLAAWAERVAALYRRTFDER